MLDDAGFVWRKMLDEAPDAFERWDKYAGSLSRLNLRPENMYCPECGRDMRMRVELLAPRAYPRHDSPEPYVGVDNEVSHIQRWLLIYRCVQCDSRFTALLYPAQTGIELIVLPEKRMGIATPRTPQAVAHYLEEARRSEAVGAFSAATVMYRAALEQFLHGQGFKQNRLVDKITALEAQKADPAAPSWVRFLDPRVLTVMKNLGNVAVHPTDGDISPQSVLNKGLLADVKIAFSNILNTALEHPVTEQERLARLVTAESTANPKRSAQKAATHKRQDAPNWAVTCLLSER